jgi:hypothetical protein
MLIKIISVEANAVPGKQYKKIEVAFKNDKGEVKGKNLMDFGIKSGIDILLNAKAGDALDVLTVKEGEYWNWKEVKKAGEGSFEASAPTGGSSAPSKGASTYQARDFETKEERAARQVMIVRQSSISSAVSLLKTEKNVPSVDEVLRVASAFEEFVLKTKSPVAAVIDMDDDVPM